MGWSEPLRATLAASSAAPSLIDRTCPLPGQRNRLVALRAIAVWFKNRRSPLRSFSKMLFRYFTGRG
jgi:hypothetical protein